MGFEIIHDAPPPPQQRKGIYAKLYHFEKMKPGSAFFAPDDMGRTEKGLSRRMRSIVNSARTWRIGHNLAARFTVRVLPAGTIMKDGVALAGDMVGCWRVE